MTKIIENEFSSYLYQIYKITNLTTNESYVGYSKDAKNRIKEHMGESKYNGSKLLRTAINLFGPEHFTAAVIDGAESKEEALQKKNKYIQIFKCEMPNGYNLRGNRHHTWPEIRKVNIRGSQNKSSKLSEWDVIQILKDVRIQKEIAKDYNVSPATISKIKKRQSWSHLG